MKNSSIFRGESVKFQNNMALLVLGPIGQITKTSDILKHIVRSKF
jgi:hypothetical protein